MKKFLSQISLVFIATIALVCGLFFGLGETKKTKAFIELGTSENISKAAMVGEIWDEYNRTFNRANLNRLMQLVTANTNASVTNMSIVANAASGGRSAFAIRTNLNVSNTSVEMVLDKTNEQDIVVILGGLKWTPVRLSYNTNRKPILTLWMATGSREAQWNDNYSTGWMSASAAEKTAIAYATYDNSVVRKNTLNAIGTPGAVYDIFTVPQEGENDLTDYIDTPGNVGWQQTAQGTSSTQLNENHLGTAAWKDDFLWLPSLSETGYESDKGGLWETSTYQRSNDKNTWLRTAYPSLQNSSYGDRYYNSYAYYLYSNGGGRSSSYLTQSSNYVVRPCLHLRLDLAAENTTASSVDLSTCTAGDIAGQSWNPAIDYTNSRNLPNVVVTDSSGYVLVKGGDYTLSTANPITGPGYVTLIITGNGGYTGTLTKSFYLDQRDISVALRNNDAALTVPNQFYTGSAIEPTLTNLRDYGYTTPLSTEINSPTGIPLSPGTDYILSYRDNTNPGSATITITGNGRYTGTYTTSFAITTPSLTGGSLTLNESSVEWNFGENVLGGVTYQVTIGSAILTKDVDYSISYYNASGTGDALTSISAIGKYLVRAKGMGRYEGQLETDFAVTERTIQDSYVHIVEDILTYNGRAQNAEIDVYAEYVKNAATATFNLVEDTHYTVVCTNNINASSSATIVVTGKGSFKGEVTKTYTINPKTLDDVEPRTVSSHIYNGKPITPTFTLYDSETGKSLVENTDFTATYSNNIDASTQAVINITGKGNYNTGSKKTFNFTILPKSIVETTFASIPDQTYSGKGIEPSLNLTDGTYSLVRDKDYTVTFTNNVLVGTATVVVRGKGNYNASTSRQSNFTILKANLTGFARMTLSPSSTNYTGRSVRTTVTVTLNSNTVAEDNYTVEVLRNGSVLTGGFSEVIEADTYVIRATGKTNYEGVVQENFTVERYDISNINVVLDKTSFNFNKAEQKPIERLTYADIELVRDTDYTIEYRQTSVSGMAITNPTNANRYYVVISAIGNFKGTNSRYYFDINPAMLSSGVVEAIFTTNGTNSVLDTSLNNLGFVFNYKPQRLNLKSLKIDSIEFYDTREATYLEVEYLRNGSETTDYTHAGTITIKITSLSGNISGEKEYNYEIERRDLETALNENCLSISGVRNYTYDRNPHNTQEISIIDIGANNYILDSNDYTIDYNGNACINAGTVDMKILGNASGNYQGSIIKPFIIEKAVIDYFELNNNSGDYNTRPHSISAVAKAGTMELTSEEYTLKYYRGSGETDDITNAGQIMVILEGKENGNFERSSGVFERIYTINTIAINSVSLGKSSIMFDNKFHELDIVSVLAGTANTPLLTTDYSISCVNSKNNTIELTDGKLLLKDASTYKITIEGRVIPTTGDKNASGEKEITFKVEPRALTSGVIKYYACNEKDEFDEPRKQIDVEADYRGQRVKPEIIVSLPEATTLQMSSDISAGTDVATGDFSFAVYDISDTAHRYNLFRSTNYLTVGEYTFVINGINNYSGTIEKNYKVNLGTFSQLTIEIAEIRKDTTYTGDPITFNFNTTSNKPNEIIIQFKDNKLGSDYKEEIFFGKHFTVFNGYVQLTLNGNEITGVQDVTETVASNPEYATNNEHVLQVVDGYVNNTNVGTATLVIKSLTVDDFNTNFEAGKLVAFHYEISKLKITKENTTIDVANKEFIYNGGEVVTLDKIVVKRENVRLDYEQDYTLTIQAETNKLSTILINSGDVTINIKGINSFAEDSGFDFTFKIIPRPLTESMFSISESVVYNKLEQRPVISASFSYESRLTALAPNVDFTVTYTRNGVETDDFVSAGILGLSITGKGNFSGSVNSKTFEIEKQVINEIVLDKISAVFTGSAHKFVATVKDIDNKDVDSKEYNITGVSSDGYINAGAYEVVVSPKEDGNYKVVKAKVYTIFTITKAPLANTTGTIPSKTYTGYNIRPTLDEIKLALNSSFSLETNEYVIEDIQNNINASTEALVVLRATERNFTGRKNVNFTILPKNIESDIEVENAQAEYMYTGEGQTPKYILTYSSQTLAIERDYTVAITRTTGNRLDTENKDIGDFSVVIKGKGNYTGELTNSFTISSRDISDLQNCRVEVTIEGEDVGFVYSGTKIEPNITKVLVSFDNKTLTLNTTEYTKEYINTTDAGDATVKISGRENFTGDFNRIYKINPRAFKKSELNITIADKTYTGNRIYLNTSSEGSDISVILNTDSKSISITSDDYDVQYTSSPVDANTYMVILKGKRNYSGSVDAQFKVIPINLKDAEISVKNGDQFYSTTFTGSNLRYNLIDNIVVTVGDSITLKHGYDYDFTFGYNDKDYVDDETYLTNAGNNKTFKIVGRTGNRNITGENSSSFSIGTKELERSMVTISNEKVYYNNGNPVNPSYKIEYNGIPLVEGTDFRITFAGNILANSTNASSYTIIGLGNFSSPNGAITGNFSIEKAIPVITLKNPNQLFFVGDEINASSFELEQSTTGNIKFDNTKLERPGTTRIKYTFTPTGPDAANYRVLSGNDYYIEINTVYYITIEFRYRNVKITEETADVEAGNNSKVDVIVQRRRSKGADPTKDVYDRLLEGSNYTVKRVLTDNGTNVTDCSVAGRYLWTVEITGERESYSIQEGTESLSFYAKSKTLYCKNAPFFAVNTSRDGFFEEGSYLEVETLETKRQITNIISAEDYDRISNIGKMYRVVGIKNKNGVSLPLNNVAIYFTPNSSNYHTYTEGEAMSSAYSVKGNIEVEVGSYYIEAERDSSNLFMIIGIIAGAVVVLAVVVIVLVKVSANRKLRRATSGNSSVDIERLNALANSASMARASGGTINVQSLINNPMAQQGVPKPTPQPNIPQGQVPPQANQPMPPQGMMPPQQGMPNGMSQGQPMQQPQSMPRPMNNGMPPQGMPPRMPNGMPQGQGQPMPPRPNAMPNGMPPQGQGMPPQNRPPMNNGGVPPQGGMPPNGGH